MKRLMVMMVLASLVVETSGCGTLLYPERKNQPQGKLDIGVVALDGVGLLFFIVPGVIAYAVDFNNGTIYLPKGQTGLLPDKLSTSGMRPIHVGNMSEEHIRKVIYTETGKILRNSDNVEVYRIDVQGKKVPMNAVHSL